MTQTVGKWVDAAEGLKKMADREMNIAASMKVSRLMKKLAFELEAFGEAREKLFRKYGTEKNGQLQVDRSAPEYAKFLEEFQQLLREELTIEVQPLSAASLGIGKMTPLEALSLGDLLEE